MAHSLSAKKRIRQNEKHRARNRWRKSKVKSTIREFTDALHGSDKPGLEQKLRACYKQLDQVAAKGTIHKKTAARKKARLTRAMNKATA